MVKVKWEVQKVTGHLGAKRLWPSAKLVEDHQIRTLALTRPSGGSND